MENLILCRQRMDCLEVTEYEEFTVSIGRELMTSILFKGLHQELLNQNKINIVKINGIINKIIESRKKTKKIISKNDRNEEDQDIDIQSNHDENEKKEDEELKVLLFQ